jgi:DNA polymerase-3 subunit alpha
MNPGFVHLHNHSEFSLLDGACRIKDMVARTAQLGMSACAITDHGVLDEDLLRKPHIFGPTKLSNP